MGRRITSVDSEEFDALFTTFKQSAFRLETLQVYAANEDDVRAVLSGETRPANPMGEKWDARIRADRVAGKAWQRVHVIEEPLTDYMRYEMTVYVENVTAGEDVRVIPVRRGDWPPSVPRHDWWLFDDTDLWLMSYDPTGALLAVEQVEDLAEVDQHRRWRDAAVRASSAWSAYMTGAELPSAV